MANNWHQNKIDSVHFVLCPKQGNGMQVVSNPQRPTYIEILVKYPCFDSEIYFWRTELN